MSLAAGTRLGPYEILSSIGAGGMGEVYRARDSKLNRDVAIKVLPSHLAQEPAALARFEREAQAVAALSHPNILAIHDFGSHDGVAYAVMELLAGETLRARLTAAPLSVRKAADFGVQIVRGIAAAHEKGIIHRDLKPENIFVTTDGRVKVLDFGLAKLMGSGVPSAADETHVKTATTPGTLMGTVGYMSPEQVRGLPLDHRTDIFSFGAVLYEMLAGRRPFHADSHVETMNAILNNDPAEFVEVSSQVPASLDRIVRRCLEKRSDERFHSAHDLGLALEAFSGTSGQSAAFEPVAAPSRRRMLWLVAAAVVAVVGAAAFVTGRKTAGPGVSSAPTYHRLTFRRGSVGSAHFAPDGKTIVYSADWGDGALQMFATRQESPESLTLPFTDADVASISSTGEVALIMNRRTVRNYARVGTLARAPLSGGAARSVLEDVQGADWLLDGSGFVAARYVEGRYRLEFPVGKVVYDMGGYISDPRVSPDGRLVAFADHPLLGDDRGAVAIVDAAGAVRKVTAEYSSIQGVAWSPAGDEILFTASDQGSARALLAVTPAGRMRTRARVPGNLHLGDVGADGSVLLWQESSRIGIAGRAPGESKDRDLSWFDWSISPSLSQDGRMVLFAEQGDGGGPEYSVYLRGMDGSPAVRLGTGNALALSPDGKWALTQRLNPAPAQLVLLPTGAGEARQVRSDGLAHEWGAFTTDGTEIVFAAAEPGHRLRMYRQDLVGGAPRAITPEGVVGVMSPDGTWVAGGRQLHPAKGGPAHPIPGLAAEDAVVDWTSDSRGLYVRRPGDADAVLIARLDITTGRRTPVRQILPPPGALWVGGLFLTGDASAYVFTYAVWQADLYRVTGLR